MHREVVRITEDVMASKEKRFANLVIDYFARIAMGFGIGVLIGLISEFTNDYTLYEFFFNSGTLMDYLLAFMIILIYYTTIETITGRSLGKYITNTKVVLKDGSKPSINEILIRTLCRMIPLEGLSFLGKLGSGWHDTMSNTYVVDCKKYDEKKTMATDLELIGVAQED